MIELPSDWWFLSVWQNKLKFSSGFDRFSGVAPATNTWVGNQYATSNL